MAKKIIAIWLDDVRWCTIAVLVADNDRSPGDRWFEAAARGELRHVLRVDNQDVAVFEQGDSATAAGRCSNSHSPVAEGRVELASGSVVVVGNQVTFTPNGTLSVPGLARLTSSGELDPTFGNGGIVVNSVPGGLSAVAVQPADDKIVAVGIDTDGEVTVSRYLAQ